MSFVDQTAAIGAFFDSMFRESRTCTLAIVQPSATVFLVIEVDDIIHDALYGELVASCTTREAAEAACRLLQLPGEDA